MIKITPQITNQLAFEYTVQTNTSNPSIIGSIYKEIGGNYVFMFSGSGFYTSEDLNQIAKAVEQINHLIR